MLFIERCAGEQGLRPSASLPTAMTGHFHHRDLRKGCCLSSTKTSRAGPISSRHTNAADSQTAKEALSDTPADNSIQQVRRPGSILCRHLGQQGLDSPCLREDERRIPNVGFLFEKLSRAKLPKSGPGLGRSCLPTPVPATPKHRYRGTIEKQIPCCDFAALDLSPGLSAHSKLYPKTSLRCMDCSVGPATCLRVLCGRFPAQMLVLTTVFKGVQECEENLTCIHSP